MHRVRLNGPASTKRPIFAQWGPVVINPVLLLRSRNLQIRFNADGSQPRLFGKIKFIRLIANIQALAR